MGTSDSSPSQLLKGSRRAADTGGDTIFLALFTQQSTFTEESTLSREFTFPFQTPFYLKAVENYKSQG